MTEASPRTGRTDHASSNMASAEERSVRLNKFQHQTTPNIYAGIIFSKMLKMKFEPGKSYHIYNQGNNKEQLFFCDEQYAHFLSLFKSYVLPHCDVLAWCLIPNHFHFLIYTDERILIFKPQGGLSLDPVTNGFRKLLSAYSHAFNKDNNRSGALFRPKTKSKCLNSDELELKGTADQFDYLFNCFSYILAHPVKHGIVKVPVDWQWSSIHDYLGEENGFCNKELAHRLHLV
jgi:putative transposase